VVTQVEPDSGIEAWRCDVAYELVTWQKAPIWLFLHGSKCQSL